MRTLLISSALLTPYFFLISILLFIACSNDDPLEELDPLRQQYNNFCGDINGGTIDFKLGNDDWRTNCMFTYGYEQAVETGNTIYNAGLLYIYSFNINGSYYEGEIETVWAGIGQFAGKGIYNGDAVFGAFFTGLYLQGEVAEEEERYFYSQGDASDKIEITEYDGSTVKGNVDITLYRESDETPLPLKGQFEGRLEQ